MDHTGQIALERFGGCWLIVLACSLFVFRDLKDTGFLITRKNDSSAIWSSKGTKMFSGAIQGPLCATHHHLNSFQNSIFLRKGYFATRKTTRKGDSTPMWIALQKKKRFCPVVFFKTRGKSNAVLKTVIWVQKWRDVNQIWNCISIGPLCPSHRASESWRSPDFLYKFHLPSSRVVRSK